MRQGKLTQFLTQKPAAAVAPAPANEPAVTPAAATAGAAGRIPRACKLPAAAASSTAAAAAAPAKCCDHGAAGSHEHAGADDEEVEERGDTHHCGQCEGRGNLFLCDGPCGRGFHPDCMPECPDTGEGEQWFCKECRDRVHECFLCHQEGEDDKEVFLCSARLCGKFYHRECVQQNKLTRPNPAGPAGSFFCPRHRCASCSHSLLAKRVNYVMCLRCTNSYHCAKKLSRCVPQAGVYEFMDGNFILCNTDQETVQSTTDKSSEDTASLGDWDAFVITAALDKDTATEETALAASTGKKGKKQRTPAGLPPFNPFAVPAGEAAPAASPAAAANSMADVPVAAAAASSSSATAAAAAAAASASSATAAASAGSSGSRVSVHFPSVSWSPPIAEEEFSFDGGVGGRKAVPQATPPYFKRVSANQYGQFVAKPTRASEDAQELCMCKEQNDKCESNCINRAVYVECTRKCPNGAECRNQRISRHEYAKTQVVLTESRGWGLIAKEDLAEGALVIEYCGEMIDDEECTRRLNETEVTGKKDYYFFKLGPDLVIDAGPIGNNARFLNHSCSPNCKTEMWTIGAQQRVGIFTMQAVPKGTELTYDYNFEGFWQPGAALKCMCGAPNCAGTLGGKKKSAAELEASNAAAAGGGKSKKGAAALAAAKASAAAKKGVETKRRRQEEEAKAQAAAAAAEKVKAEQKKARRQLPLDRSARGAVGGESKEAEAAAADTAAPASMEIDDSAKQPLALDAQEADSFMEERKEGP